MNVKWFYLLLNIQKFHLSSQLEVDKTFFLTISKKKKSRIVTKLTTNNFYWFDEVLVTILLIKMSKKNE